MDQSTYSLERVIQVWNDKTGEHIDFRPDRDGLGLWEIVSFSSDGVKGGEITLTTEQVQLLFPAALKEVNNQ